jgi:hypothetical protein
MRLTTIVHHITPFAAVAGGILVLPMPRLLNHIIAIYLILVGVIGLSLDGLLCAARLCPRRPGRRNSRQARTRTKEPHDARRRSMT